MVRMAYLLAFFLIFSYSLELLNDGDKIAFNVTKEYIEDPYIWYFDLQNRHQPSSPNSANPELMYGNMTIESVDSKVLHLKIVNATGKRWEAPLYNPNPMKNYKKAMMTKMGFVYEKTPFVFNVSDPDTKQAFVSLSLDKNGSLQFYDKYLEIGLWYSNKRIFGLGERTTPDFELCHHRQDCVYTIFGKDQLNPLDEGIPPGGKQTYGNHPFYMIQLKNYKFMATFLMTTNAQDVAINKLPNDELNVIHKIVGGVFDMYFFYPCTAECILKKYHDLIGRPYMIPFWTLGFHQCRWGWRTLNKVKEVVARYEEADIPLEVVWGDIDYMHKWVDFTIDEERYGGLPEFVNDLHKKKMKWVPIIDAGLNYSLTDKYIIKGENMNCFIKSAKTKKTLIGKVWPGYTAYVDFVNPNGTLLWHEGLSDLYQKVKFDGIWLDMNEIANWCDNGECDVNFTLPSSSVSEADPHDPTEFDNLPYTPGNSSLYKNTISMTAYHYHKNDEEDKFFKEYNLHATWPVTEVMSTHQFLVDTIKKRPYILSRSSFVGLGMYGTLWTADVESSWEFLRYSIISVLNFQQFGVPFSGGDICGFFKDTTEELCGRWMQLGSFFPFSRNHNALDARDHEPYVFGERVSKASRNAIRQKYSILLYYYTKLYEASLYGGGVINPLFYEFPEDNKAYLQRNDTFLIGKSILVIPVLYKDATTVNVYCPNENWYDLRSRTQRVVYDKEAKEGKTLTLPGDFEYVNLFIRGGSIIPFQDALALRVRRTAALAQMPVEIIIAPDKDGNAQGTWIVDDWDSLNPIENELYRHMKFSFSMSKARLDVNVLSIKYTNHFLYEKFAKLTIMGAEPLKDLSKACIYGEAELLEEISGRYDSGKKTLSFSSPKSGPYWSHIVNIDFAKECGQNK